MIKVKGDIAIKMDEINRQEEDELNRLDPNKEVDRAKMDKIRSKYDDIRKELDDRTVNYVRGIESRAYGGKPKSFSDRVKGFLMRGNKEGKGSQIKRNAHKIDKDGMYASTQLMIDPIELLNN